MIKDMKKIYSFMLSAVAVLAAASCAQIEQNLPQEPTGETVTFTATTDATKTVLVDTDEVNATEWVSGDKITIHNGTSGYEFTTADAGSRAVFSYVGTDFSGEKFIAVYPAGTYEADVQAKTVKANIPTYQASRSNTYNEGAALAVAYTESNSLAFKNASALLKFTVKGNNIKGVIFYGHNGEAVSGDVLVTLDAEGKIASVVPQETTITENDVTETKMITYAKIWAETENYCFAEETTYYLAVVPQTFDKGFTVQLELDGVANKDVKKLETSYELKPNTILNIGELEYVEPEAEPFVPQEGYVYLQPSREWAEAGARFAAYFFNNGESWVNMELVPGQINIYGCAIPEGFTDVIFCRMNPAAAENNWDNKWNQSEDLVMTEGNLYIVSGWDKGAWTGDPAVQKPAEPETPTVVPGEASEWAIIGDFNGTGTWVERQMVTTAETNVFVIKEVSIPQDYFSLLVKKFGDSTWSVKYGGGIVYFNPGNKMKVTKGGSDISITKAGTYDFYFDLTNTMLHVVAPGTDYTSVPEQTVNGEEPKQEEPEVTEKMLYLKPNSNWTQSNARFAVYFWNDSGSTWVSMTDSDKDGIYEVHLPEGYDYGCNVIFCRMNPSTTANNWNNKWNQTADLKAPTDGKNLYTVKSGTWDNGGGTWSVK